MARSGRTRPRPLPPERGSAPEQVHHGALAAATPINADTASASSVQLTNASILTITHPLNVLAYRVAVDPPATTVPRAGARQGEVRHKSATWCPKSGLPRTSMRPVELHRCTDDVDTSTAGRTGLTCCKARVGRVGLRPVNFGGEIRQIADYPRPKLVLPTRVELRHKNRDRCNRRPSSSRCR